MMRVRLDEQILNLDWLRRQSRTGFTLIEILLTVALISAIFAMSAPILNSWQWRSEMNVIATETAQSFRRAETLARAGEGDSQWGVRVETGSVILFKGISYATRDGSYDEEFSYITAINRSGLQEVVFAKLTGEPSATGTVTFTSPQGQTKAVTINSEGAVSY